jgi:hypothetical protein
MKILITEEQRKKIYNIIYDYIDELFGILVESQPIVGENLNVLELFFSNELQMKLLKDNYFIYKEYPEDKWREISPALWVFSEKIIELNSMFADMWKPVFIDWVRNNVGDLVEYDIKSVNKNLKQYD